MWTNGAMSLSSAQSSNRMRENASNPRSRDRIPADPSELFSFFNQFIVNLKLFPLYFMIFCCHLIDPNSSRADRRTPSACVLGKLVANKALCGETPSVRVHHFNGGCQACRVDMALIPLWPTDKALRHAYPGISPHESLSEYAVCYDLIFSKAVYKIYNEASRS